MKKEKMELETQWVSQNELEEIIQKRNEETENLNQTLVKVKSCDLLKLDKISNDLGLNRGFSEKCIKVINQLDGEWSILPIMYHDFKKGIITDRHLRCMVSPRFKTSDVPQILFLDIPSDFKKLLTQPIL